MPLFAAYSSNVARASALLGKADSYSDAEATSLILSADFRKSGDLADRALNEVVRIKGEGTALAAKQAAELAAKGQLLAIWLLVIGLAGSIAFGLLVSASIRRPMNDLHKSIEDIAGGRLDILVPHTDYRNEIGVMANSLRTLQQGAQAMEAQRWVKQGLAEIDEAVQEAPTYRKFGDALAARLAPMLGLVYAALYRVEADGGGLRRVGGYGCDDSLHARSFALGQGMVGQAALDRRQIALSLPDDETVGVSLGLGKLVVRAVLISPIVSQDKVLAVLELGALEAFDERKKAFVEALLPVMATKMQILVGNVATRELLEKTQAQAKELEAGRATLAQNEERTRLILGAVGDGILGMDIDGNMTFVNPAVPAMLGYSEEELIGKPMHALVHYAYPDGREFPREECRDVPDLQGRPAAQGGRRSAVAQGRQGDSRRVLDDTRQEGRPDRRLGHRVSRHHRAQAGRTGAQARQHDERLGAGPDPGRLLADRLQRSRVLHQLRARRRHFRRAPHAGLPLPPDGRVDEPDRRRRSEDRRSDRCALRRGRRGTRAALRRDLRLQASRGWSKLSGSARSAMWCEGRTASRASCTGWRRT